LTNNRKISTQAKKNALYPLKGMPQFEKIDHLNSFSIAYAILKIKILNAKQQNPEKDLSEWENALEDMHKFYQATDYIFMDWGKMRQQNMELFNTTMKQYDEIELLKKQVENLQEHLDL